MNRPCACPDCCPNRVDPELLRVVLEHERMCHAVLVETEKLTAKGIDKNRLYNRWVSANLHAGTVLERAVKGCGCKR